MAKFRFEDLEIWQSSIELADKLLDLADTLEARHLYRFAEQLRGASMSISNNIAEGSGSNSSIDFSNFLNFARRSLFEVVNILMLLKLRKTFNPNQLDPLIDQLDMLSRKIIAFRNSLFM